MSGSGSQHHKRNTRPKGPVQTEESSTPTSQLSSTGASLHRSTSPVHEEATVGASEASAAQISEMEQLEESKAMLEQHMQELQSAFCLKSRLHANMITTRADDAAQEQIKLDIEQVQVEIHETRGSLNNIKLGILDLVRASNPMQSETLKCHYEDVSDSNSGQYDASIDDNAKLKHVKVKADNSLYVVPCNMPKFGVGKDKIYEPEAFLCKFMMRLFTHGLDIEKHWHRLFLSCLPDHDYG